MESELITKLRTAAGTAVALDQLARADARRLLVCGTGAQALPHIEAVAAIRELESVQLWGRSPERAQATLVDAQALLALDQAGYTPESAVKAVDAADVTLLKPKPDPVPVPGQPVQHMLPQTPPGVVATPLPPALGRLPVGSTSPGDGGNGSRPTPRPSSGRRALNGADHA